MYFYILNSIILFCSILNITFLWVSDLLYVYLLVDISKGLNLFLFKKINLIIEMTDNYQDPENIDEIIEE